MTNTRQLFLKLVAFNLLLSLSLLTLDAQAQRRPRRPNQPPVYGNQQQNEKIVLSHLNINVWGQKSIKVKKLVKDYYGPGLLHGKKLKRIVVKASASSYQSKIALLINGVKVTAVRNLSYYPEKIILDLPSSGYGSSNIIGRDIQTIKLKVKGDVQIKKIVLKLKDRQQSRPLVAYNINLGSRYGSADQINLAQLLQAHNIHKSVQEIRIVAKAHSRKGTLTVLSRGMGRLDTMHMNGRGYGSTQKSIYVGGQAQLSDIKLLARGDIQIQSIEVLVNHNHW